jgi:tetratricopeptide (TPR) repeat protein
MIPLGWGGLVKGKDMTKNVKHSRDFLRSLGLLLVVLALAGAVLLLVRKKPEKEGWWSQEAAPSPAKLSQLSESRPAAPAARRSYDAASNVSGPDGRELAEVQKAMALIDQGQWQEAESLLQEILRQDPKNEAALIELGMIQLLDRRDSLTAKPYLEQAFQVNPRNEVVMQELLGIYEETKTWEAGLNFFRSLPPEARQSGFADFSVGAALMALERPQEAVEAFQRAVYDVGYQAYSARESLAEALTASGRTEEAIREYEAVIMGPYMPQQIHTARVKIASLLIDRQQYAEARRILIQLQDSQPADEWVAYLLRQINERSSQF